MGLTEGLGRGPIGLDTAVFIYYIEEHPRFLPLVEPVFEGIGGGRWEAVTSGLTLLETLVVPYRSGDQGLAERYEILLTHSRGLTLLDLDRPLLRTAARLRATVGLTLPTLDSNRNAGCRPRDIPGSGPPGPEGSPSVGPGLQVGWTHDLDHARSGPLEARVEREQPAAEQAGQRHVPGIVRLSPPGRTSPAGGPRGGS